nr:hypothetical protein [uncultured Psychroserpens sp.]
MHHFLWMESFMNVQKDSTIIRQNFSKDIQQSLNQGIEYYKNNFVDFNLRSNDYMKAFKHWIRTQDFELKSVPPKFEEHINVLKSVSNVYKESFWPEHKATCENVLNDNIDLIRQTEEKFAIGIQKLTRHRWQGEKIKVDITYYGTATDWNLVHRPYTTLFPTYIVMTGIGENDIKGNWVELLFHEAAHHLIFDKYYYIGGTIKDVSEVMNVKLPRSFSHAYLFYLTGELTKQIFIEEKVPYANTYMERTGVFGSHYALLDKYLKPYMKGEITLENATRKILTEIN